MAPTPYLPTLILLAVTIVLVWITYVTPIPPRSPPGVRRVALSQPQMPPSYQYPPTVPELIHPPRIFYPPLDPLSEPISPLQPPSYQGTPTLQPPSYQGKPARQDPSDENGGETPTECGPEGSPDPCCPAETPTCFPLDQNGEPPLRGNTSQGESYMIAAFKELLKERHLDSSKLRQGVRLDFIRNPETNRRLEFDAYYEDGPYRIAVEVQGAQHYVFPNRFHPDTVSGRREFEAQRRRDAYKRMAAEKHGVFLIRIPYTCFECVSDATRVGGTRRVKRTPEEKRRLIRDYLRTHLDDYLAAMAP